MAGNLTFNTHDQVKGMCHYGGKADAYTEFWCGNLKERDHLEDVTADGRIIFKWILVE
jgi:hypothetical protein